MDWAFLELLFQGSCCLLEILAASADAGAGIAGVRARRTFDRRRAARERGEPGPSPVPGIIAFFVLLILGVVLTIAAIAKYTRSF